MVLIFISKLIKKKIYILILQLVARSTTPDNRKCVENPLFFSVRSVIVISMPELILLSSVQVVNILKQFRYNKTVIAFIWGKHQIVNTREVVLPRANALQENQSWVDNIIFNTDVCTGEYQIVYCIYTADHFSVES